ncbi:hypothetical protein [Pandoraea sp. NPDC090278]|uniref:hypothetical protein n=1 Tax=Pandoraea sp. NPDC090278 TaxID=3364391 RepID=UPI00383BDB96
MKVIENGNFSGWVCTFLIFIGILLSCFVFKYVSPGPLGVFLALLGFLMMAVGGLSSRARLLNVRPFDNEYKKARRSYDEEREGKS